MTFSNLLSRPSGAQDYARADGRALTPDLKALIDSVNAHGARLAHVAALAERGEADPERQALLANIILTISEARDRLSGIKARLS